MSTTRYKPVCVQFSLFFFLNIFRTFYLLMFLSLSLTYVGVSSFFSPVVSQHVWAAYLIITTRFSHLEISYFSPLFVSSFMYIFFQIPNRAFGCFRRLSTNGSMSFLIDKQVRPYIHTKSLLNRISLRLLVPSFLSFPHVTAACCVFVSTECRRRAGLVGSAIRKDEKKKRNESNESDTRRAAFKLLRPSVNSDGEGKRPTSSFILISLFFYTTDKGKESHALGHPAVQQFRVVDIGIEEELLLLGRNMKLAPSDRILRQQPGRPITCSFSFLFLFFFYCNRVVFWCKNIVKNNEISWSEIKLTDGLPLRHRAPQPVQLPLVGKSKPKRKKKRW